jgi:hypothetical protein
MPANLASFVKTMGQQHPRKYRSLQLLITTIITREASWQVNFVVDAFTQLDPFNLLHSRQERKKVKSNVSYCSQLIFVMLSMSPGMWLQRDFYRLC